jgi:VWFA-related protein
MGTTRRQFLLSSAALPSVVAQEPEPVFSTAVKVVSIIASVRDQQRRLVHDLAKQELAVFENNTAQDIRYFSRDTDLPLTLGILVDTSMSQEKVMSEERAASLRFIDRVLRDDKDQFFIGRFDMAVAFPQGLTASRDKLEKALVHVDTPTRAELRQQSGGGTLLFDCVSAASKDIMAKRQGRKALVILSDGGENGSDASIDDAINAAQLADTMIYSILFGGNEGYRILQRMSRETGGGYFEVTRKKPITEVFDAIQEELRGQYSLGYVSSVPVRVSEFRNLRVAAKRKGLTVQCRTKYWAERT